MAEDTILQKVQKLLDKAWSTTFEGEKQALLAKADELMVKYSIEQVQLLSPDRPSTAAVIKGSTPELREILYYGQGDQGLGYDQNTRETMARLFYSLAIHHRVRVGQYGWSMSKCVGYPADLDFLEMMFLSLRLHILQTMDPTVEMDESWEDNLAKFKNAGFKWENIHAKLKRHPSYQFASQPWTRPIGVRFTAVYKKWCDINLSDPSERVMANPKQWRESFMDGYTAEISRRLTEMRIATQKANPNLPALLADRKPVLDEAFYEWFPEQRPREQGGQGKSAVRYTKVKERPIVRSAINAGSRAAKSADLSGSNGRVASGASGSIG
jgi:hypothetical protein